MGSTLSPPAGDGPGALAGMRRGASSLVQGTMEVAVLVLVCLSPWLFGATGAEFEFLLYAGVAVLLGLWATRMLLDGELSWKNCPVAWCLAALALVAVWQLVPLPPGLLHRLAPGTARMYEQLLPAQAEVLTFDDLSDASPAATGSTISFYPGRTWQELIKLLAILLLFAVVRQNTASAGSLRRLSIAICINGALLALFALVQFFTSPPKTVYWTWPSSGAVFGPFINRNHFAFYMNLCVGSGIGLLLGSRYAAPGGARESRGQTTSTLLHDPAALWTIAALALMISSAAFCLSRGGIIALLGSWIVLLLISFLQSARLRRLGALLLILSLGLGLLSWLGLGRVEERLSTLWGNEALQESRLHLWSRLLPVAKDFPIWGTGYGTLQYVEPLSRSDPANEAIYTNAENEYLEALLEGGIVRLAVSVLAIGLIFWLGYRAVRHDQSHQASGLAMGALFGFTALVVHSFVDFGLHIPAIACLATVLCAHLCALGSARSQTIKGSRQQTIGPRPDQAEDTADLPDLVSRHGEQSRYSLRLGGLAPLVGAIVVVLFALLVVYEGWRVYKVQELLLTDARPASVVSGDGFPADERSDQVERLEAAARLAPESARLQVDLALAYYDLYKEQRKKQWIRTTVAGAAQALCDMSPARSHLVLPHSALSAVPVWVLTCEARNALCNTDERQLVGRYLVPALRCFLRARDSCPLLSEPQRFIAENRDKLARAEPLIAYLERARLLVPYDAGLWYGCGQELLDSQPDQAWKNWRRSLELSDVYRALILQQVAARLGPREILDRVLPSDPRTLVAAALLLYPEPTAKRQLFLDRALALLEQQPAPLTPGDLHVKASIQSALDRAEEALLNYRAALTREPHQVSWRFEFAQLLCQQKRLQEARRELLIVILQQAEHTNARRLLTIVERQLAKGT